MKPYIVIDTETAPAENFNPHDMANTSLVYDLGYIVTDGVRVFARRSFVVAETFDNDQLMNSAYYADKLPQYHEGMGDQWEKMPFLAIWAQFKEDCKTYGVRDVWAYNARFDRDTLNNTIETYSNGFVRFFFPYNVTIKDIWSAAGDTVCNTNKYVVWCIRNGYVKPNTGNPLTTAETVYRYLTNSDFVEAHTALTDCEIENYILQRIRKRKQKYNVKPNGNGWRKASKRAQAL